MSGLVFLICFVISVLISFFIIKIATATSSKIELLKSIEKKNNNIEILLRQLVLAKAPVKELQITDLENRSDFLAVAKSIVDELILKLIINDEKKFVHNEKAIFLGKTRSLYVKHCKENGIKEEQAINAYEIIVRDYMRILPAQVERGFVEQYIIGIRSVDQGATK